MFESEKFTVLIVRAKYRFFERWSDADAETQGLWPSETKSMGAFSIISPDLPTQSTWVTPVPVTQAASAAESHIALIVAQRQGVAPSQLRALYTIPVVCTELTETKL